MSMRIEVKVPGSCGELVQGTADGVPFLVTCPVNLYTRLILASGERRLAGFGSKAQMALERTLDYLGVKAFPFDMTLQSQLPCGKGMASSSADIAAVCIGAAAALDRELAPEEIARIAAGIEPTDGVFFKGIVKINHMTGECQEHLGIFPRLRIIVLDTGGIVDTLAFHAKNDLQRLSTQHEQATAAALELLRQPCTPERIAAAATRSALANQQRLEKKALEELVEFVLSQGALGVNAAHSGTILGVLFAPDTTAAELARQAERICRKYPHLQYLQTVELIAGGYTIEKR